MEELLEKPKLWECPYARKHLLCELCQRLPRPKCLYCGGAGYRIVPYKGTTGAIFCKAYIDAQKKELHKKLESKRKSEREEAQEKLAALNKLPVGYFPEDEEEGKKRKKVCWRLARAFAEFKKEHQEFDFDAKETLRRFRDWLEENVWRYLEDPPNLSEHPDLLLGTEIVSFREQDYSDLEF